MLTSLLILFLLALIVGLGYLVSPFNAKTAARMKLVTKFLKRWRSGRSKDLIGLPKKVFWRLPRIFLRKRKLFTGKFLKNLAQRP